MQSAYSIRAVAPAPQLSWHPTSVAVYEAELSDLERRERMARDEGEVAHAKAENALASMRAQFERDTTPKNPIAQGIGIGLIACGGVALVAGLALAFKTNIGALANDATGARQSVQAYVALGSGLVLGAVGAGVFVYGSKRVMRNEEAFGLPALRVGFGTLHLEGSF